MTLRTHTSKVCNKYTGIPRGSKLFLYNPKNGSGHWDRVKWYKSIDTHDHLALVFKMDGVDVPLERVKAHTY